MAPELRRDDITMRVDGDELEVLFPMRTEPSRILLSRLAVRLDRQGKQKLQLYIGQTGEPGPLYAWHWNPTIMGSVWMIDVDEEPAYREFFGEVAESCGRHVADDLDAGFAPKKRRFGRGSG
jgi:hypothetical protein